MAAELMSQVLAYDDIRIDGDMLVELCRWFGVKELHLTVIGEAMSRTLAAVHRRTALIAEFPEADADF